MSTGQGGLKAIVPPGSSLASNTLLNLFGQAVPAIVGIVTIPIVVGQLGVDRFGVLTLAWVILGNTAILDLGLGKAATRFAAEALARGEDERIPKILGSTIWPQLGLGLVAFLLILAAIVGLGDRVLHVPVAYAGEAQRTFLIVGILTPIIFITTSYRGILEAAHRFDLVNAFRVIFSAFTHLAPLIGVAMGWGLVGIIGLIGVSRLVQLMVMHYVCMRTFDAIGAIPRFSKDEFSGMRTFMGWVAVSNGIAPVLNHVDRLLLAALLPIRALTYFAVPFDALTALCMAPASLATPLSPLATAMYDERTQELSSIVRRSVLVTTLVMGLALLPVVSLADVILAAWAGKEIAAASSGVARFLAIGILATSLNLLGVALFQGCKRPDLVVKQQLIRAPIAIMGSWVLVSRFGLIGAGASWAFGQTLTTGLYTWSIGRVLPSAVNPAFMSSMARALIAVVTTCLGTVVLGQLFNLSTIARILLTAAAMAALASLSWSRFLEPDERVIARQIMARAARAARTCISSLLPRRNGSWGVNRKRHVVLSQLEGGLRLPLQLKRSFVTPRGVLVLDVYSPNNDTRYFAKTDIHDRGGSVQVANAAALQRLAKLPVPIGVDLPRSIAFLEPGGNDWPTPISIETAVDGADQAWPRARQDHSERLKRGITAWERLTTAWSSPAVEGDRILAERVAEDTKVLQHYGVTSIPREGLDSAMLHLKTLRWPRFMGPEHGDFAPGNVLFKQDGRIAIVDWSELKCPGLPEFDLVHFVLYSQAESARRRVFEEWADVIRGHHRGHLIVRYGDARMVSAIGVVYWMHFLARSVGHVDERWKRRHVDAGFELIKSTWKAR